MTKVMTFAGWRAYLVMAGLVPRGMTMLVMTHEMWRADLVMAGLVPAISG